MLGAIHLFDPHPHTLQRPHAAAIEQFRHQLRYAHHGIQHAECVGFGEDRGQACGLPRADRVHRLDLPVQDGLVEQQQRTQGLMLRGRRHMALHGHVRQKCFAFLTPHLFGMAFLMKQNKTSRPIDVGIFRTDRVMLRVQDVPPLVEQLLGSLFLAHTRANLLALYT